MPRTPAKFTQADIGRAIREMMKAFGSAQVVFDAEGNMRVLPLMPVNDAKAVDDASDSNGDYANADF